MAFFKTAQNLGVRVLNEEGETDIAEIFKYGPKDGFVKNKDALVYQAETDNRNSENPNILGKSLAGPRRPATLRRVG